ncbi:MAG TPA: DNA polymerase III subunit delta' [Acidobacteriota bacterium]|nr:DNA polymerase III subunit delta' [Acidobacteriota bacterium]
MKRLADFIGNDKTVRLLSGLNELPQSSIFAGPEGVGKKTCALMLAALANCREPQEDDLCGRCPSCIKAASGNHPDIQLFQPEGANIKIEAMREMSREAQFRPYEGRLRFFIIDQADRLSEAAANSILKTLEEPPSTSRLILVTAHPQRLLITIRSRCQTFAFHPLSRDEIVDWLQRTDTPGDPRQRAAFAEGSIGTALDLDLERMAEDRELMLGLLEKWTAQQSFAGFFFQCEDKALQPHLKKRDRVVELLDRLQSLGEDLYFFKVLTPQRVVHQDLAGRLEAVADRVSLDWISDFLYHIAQARQEVERYVNPLMCFETLWLGCRLGKPAAKAPSGRT